MWGEKLITRVWPNSLQFSNAKQDREEPVSVLVENLLHEAVPLPFLYYLDDMDVSIFYLLGDSKSC